MIGIKLVFLSIIISRLPFCYIHCQTSNSFVFSFFIRAPPKLMPLLNYSTNWLDLDIKDLKKPLKRTAACLAIPKHWKTSNSTPDDLIITTLFGQTIGLLPFIRTWSSAVSKATCVILIDNKAKKKMDKENITEDEIKKRGIHLINVGTLYPPPRIGKGFYFIPNLELATKFGRYFKRIIITDCNDVVFQGDPFQSGYQWDSIGFHFEHFYIEEEETNQMWIREMNSWIPSWNMKSEQANLGLMSGNADIFEIISNLMFYLWDAPNFHSSPNDQGMVNYLIMNSFLSDAGIDYHTRSRMMLGFFRLAVFTEEYYPFYTNFFADEDSIIIHYYMLDNESQKKLRKLCNMTGYRQFKWIYSRESSAE